jgi:hypothetical protein
MEDKCQVLEALKPSTNVADVEEAQGGKQQQDSNSCVAMTSASLCCVLRYVICLNVQHRCSAEEILGLETQVLL